MVQYKEWLFALVSGAIVGFAFAKLKLPVPAPPTIAGILGIIGITLGYVLGKR
ncbi:MAG TPA: XapX domain-containing protein [Symbiobacteriaceae bacterium]|nr:XapX domain-containing protein [Symbiobacteriaceae bacterium]